MVFFMVPSVRLPQVPALIFISIFVFAVIYWMFGPNHLYDNVGKSGIDLMGTKLGFINDNHFIDFLYFSIVTQSLLGYGDIIPATRIMRGVVSIQVIISLIILLSTGSAMLTKLLK